jgi:hypothetical protein
MSGKTKHQEISKSLATLAERQNENPAVQFSWRSCKPDQAWMPRRASAHHRHTINPIKGRIPGEEAFKLRRSISVRRTVKFAKANWPPAGRHRERGYEHLVAKRPPAD